jgi:hypothetical protein
MLDRLSKVSYISTMKKEKRPRDTNQLAKNIVDIAIGEAKEEPPKDTKNPHAVELGRLGGLKGGKARAEKLTEKQRKDIAQKAASARWNKRK